MPTALAETAAERLIARIDANPGRAAICLTGGSSPQQLYRVAGDAALAPHPLGPVDWFIGDERFVPQTDPHNNLAMARRPFSTPARPPQHPSDPDDASRSRRSGALL